MYFSSVAATRDYTPPYIKVLPCVCVEVSVKAFIKRKIHDYHRRAISAISGQEFLIIFNNMFTKSHKCVELKVISNIYFNMW
jgi:hypothetical protein